MISRDEGLFYMKARKVSIIVLACLQLSKTENVYVRNYIYAYRAHVGNWVLTGYSIDLSYQSSL
jgi:hypothetical protein